MPVLFALSTWGLLYFVQSRNQQYVLIIMASIAYYLVHICLYRLRVYYKDETARGFIAAVAHGQAHGDAVNQALLFPNEFEAAQRDYPILFRRDDRGGMRRQRAGRARGGDGGYVGTVRARPRREPRLEVLLRRLHDRPRDGRGDRDPERDEVTS